MSKAPLPPFPVPAEHVPAIAAHALMRRSVEAISASKDTQIVRLNRSLEHQDAQIRALTAQHKRIRGTTAAYRNHLELALAALEPFHAGPVTEDHIKRAGEVFKIISEEHRS